MSNAVDTDLNALERDLVRNLDELGYDADQLREVFRWIDRMMRIRAGLDQQFEQVLTEFEEARNMRYITSVEKVAEARDEARGTAHGTAKTLGRIVSRTCRPLSDNIRERIQPLSIESLDELTEVATTLRSLGDLEKWLDQSQSKAC